MFQFHLSFKVIVQLRFNYVRRTEIGLNCIFHHRTASEKKVTHSNMAPPMSASSPEPLHDQPAFHDQLKRILSSQTFSSSQRSRDFLQTITEETLAGRGPELTQHVIAETVFGRGDEFDPTLDPIVRIQAGRVRKLLAHYYLTEGAHDTVEIQLPKGSYIPRFRPRTPSINPSVPEPPSWPVMLITPLENLTGQESHNLIARGLSSHLAAELSRFKNLQIVLSPPDTPTSPDTQADYSLGGTVSSRGEELRITLHLQSHPKRLQIWARTFTASATDDPGSWIDEAVQSTVATLAEEKGVLHQDLRKRPTASLDSANLALLHYHRFETDRTPENFASAFTALQQSVQKHPNCALCWCYLARLAIDTWSLDLPLKPLSIHEAVAAARRGAGLAPENVQARAILSYVLLITDERDEARQEAEAALALTEGSIYWLDAVGYLLALSGDWERGPELVRRAMTLNPYPRRACYGALWVDALLREDAPAALAAARAYAPETHFWQPLTQTVALILNHRPKAAAEQVRHLLELKPDFAAKGHHLITRYVKDRPAIDTIETALQEAGLPLN